MNKTQDIVLLPHQSALIKSIWKHTDISYFFMTGGFGCGKSFTDVALVLTLVGYYNGEYLSFGIGGAALKHLRETVIKDIMQFLDRHKIPYKHNTMASVLQIGTLQFVYFSLDRPDSIFGFNFAGALMDEAGELKERERVKDAFLSVQERCRVNLPALSTQPIARQPFIVSTTTAQGFDGVYLLKEYLCKQKMPYLDLKARTKDNPHLSQSQIDNLYKLYTPEEARVYLEGEYLNLTAGRVYAEFTDDNILPDKTVDTILELNSYHIYVGQDFNPGYNQSIEGFIAKDCDDNPNIYILNEHRWSIVGDAPRQLRMLYPIDKYKCTFIPDVSGKELCNAYFEEFEQYAIERVWSNVNPPITDRILAVNKLLRLGRLHIAERCSNLITTLKTRGFDDNGKPYKGKGPNATDHAGDACEYLCWFIVHSILGFESIKNILRSNRGGSDTWQNFLVFDLDGTVWKAAPPSQPIIVRKTGEMITVEEWAKRPDKTVWDEVNNRNLNYDFSLWDLPEEVSYQLMNATPLVENIAYIREHQNRGYELRFLTTRGTEDIVKEAVLNMFGEYIEGWALGDSSRGYQGNSVADRKRIILQELVQQYDKVIFIDDDEKNRMAAKEVSGNIIVVDAKSVEKEIYD